MSTVVFVNQKKIDKKLIQEFTYKYHPSSDMKEQILKDLHEHIKCDLEDFIIDVDIRIILKEYDKKPADNGHWYDDKLKPNDTKNT